MRKMQYQMLILNNKIGMKIDPKIMNLDVLILCAVSVQGFQRRCMNNAY